jgi:arsenate reductase-like glutaredoxin family protein
LDAHGLEPKEIVSANKKLSASDAAEIVKAATRVVVAKGTKLTEFTPGGKPGKEVIEAMLGPTGNLRAPCIKAGKTVLVGFNDDAYRDALL